MKHEVDGNGRRSSFLFREGCTSNGFRSSCTLLSREGEEEGRTLVNPDAACSLGKVFESCGDVDA